MLVTVDKRDGILLLWPVLTDSRQPGASGHGGHAFGSVRRNLRWPRRKHERRRRRKPPRKRLPRKGLRKRPPKRKRRKPLERRSDVTCLSKASFDCHNEQEAVGFPRPLLLLGRDRVFGSRKGCSFRCPGGGFEHPGLIRRDRECRAPRFHRGRCGRLVARLLFWSVPRPPHRCAVQ